MMIDPKDIERALNCAQNSLFKNSEKRDVDLTPACKNKYPEKPGVYVLFKGRKAVYVGETANIQKRVNNLRSTRNHTIRRTIGKKYFSDSRSYELATSNKKFPNEIEKQVNKFINEKLQISIMEINFGRKEVEEYLIKKYQPCFNQK